MKAQRSDWERIDDRILFAVSKKCNQLLVFWDDSRGMKDDEVQSK